MNPWSPLLLKNLLRQLWLREHPKNFKSVGVQTDLSSKDEGKVLAPSKKLQTSQTSNPQDQLQTNLTNLTKKTLGEAKSRSPKTITNNQNMGNRFEALSVESDESAMETEKFVRWVRV